MTVTNVISPLMVYLDRFLIAALISMSAVAYYSTPYDMVTKLWIVPASIIGTLFPALSTLYGHARVEAAALFHQALRAVFVAVFPPVLAIAVLAPEVLEVWLGGEFAQNSAASLRWLVAGVFVNCLAQVVFAAVQSAGRPDLTAKLHAVELPLYLAVLWNFTVLWGIEGAAIAWALRVTVDAGALLILASKVASVPVRAAYQVALCTGVALIALAAGVALEGRPIKLTFLGLGLPAFAIIAWTRLIAPTERDDLRNWFAYPAPGRKGV